MTVIYVQPGENINTAISAASPGDTISLADGVHDTTPYAPPPSANVNVSKQLTVTATNPGRATVIGQIWVSSGGAGATIQDIAVNSAGWNSYAVSVHPSGVTLRRLRVTNGNTDGAGALAIGLGTSRASGCLVEECVVHDWGADSVHDHCLYLQGDNATIRDCLFYGCAGPTVLCYPDPQTALIEYCTIVGGVDGVKIGGDTVSVKPDGIVFRRLLIASQTHAGAYCDFSYTPRPTNCVLAESVIWCPSGTWGSTGDADWETYVATTSITETNPRFRDAAARDYVLQPGSPADRYAGARWLWAGPPGRGSRVARKGPPRPRRRP